MKLLKRTSVLVLTLVFCTPSTLAAPPKGYRWASGAEAGRKRQDYIGAPEKYTEYNPNGFHERIMREKKQAALQAARKAALDLEYKRSAEITKMLKKGETTKAIRMLKSMDLEGSPDAAFWLGRLYLGNSGVEVDHDEAFKWLSISTRRGNRQASIDLARMYVNGWGTPASNEKAIVVLEKAKTPKSQYTAGCICVNQAKPDYVRAEQFFRQAASKKVPAAEASLGELSLFGLGAKQDLVLAKRLFENAAEKKNPMALFYLGKMYELGIGVKKSSADAKRYSSSFAEKIAEVKPSEDKLAEMTNKSRAALEQQQAKLLLLAQSTASAAPTKQLASGEKEVVNSTVVPTTNEASLAIKQKQSSAPSPQPVKEKNLPEVYKDVENLVHTYYPDAEISKSDDGMHFEFKTKMMEQNRLTVKAPRLGGIVGDIKVTPGRYEGNEYLPMLTHDVLFSTLLLAPYSNAEKSHLHTKLLFPPNAPAPFLNSFKKVLAQY